MAQNTVNDFGNNEDKDRSGWPISLIALLIAAGAAGGGYWLAAKRTPDVVAPKVDVAAQPAPAPAKTEVAQTDTAKPAEVKASASNSVEVAKTPELEAAIEAKPVESVKVEVETPKVASAPEPVKIAEPAAEAEASKVDEPKAVDPDPVVVEVKPEETQVAVAVPEVVPEPPKAAEAAPAAVEVPSFDTVRVEPTGDAIIAGRAAPGTEVTIKLGGQAIGKAVADSTGAFAYVSEKPLPPGAAALSLETTVGGKAITSEQTVAVAVKADQKSEPLVAVVKPDAPTKIVQAPKAAEPVGMTDSVKLDAVDYDAFGNIIFSGRGKPGASVRIYVDNTAAGEVKADDTGRWMFAGTSAVAAGTHMLRADEIGANGKVSSRIELPFLREEPAKVAAVAPAAAEPATTEPAPAQVAIATEPQPMVPPEPSRMVIQPGNNLWKLSRQVYGKGIQYTVIYEANKDQIRDPDLIYPGQVFVMPTVQP